jgi:CHAT domain-containing protein
VRDAVIDRLFAGAANDLSVPTRSAYEWNGATGFPLEERLILPSARGVDHSTFWWSPDVAHALETWLRADQAALRPPPVASPAFGGGARTRAAVRGADVDEPDPFHDVDERLAAGDLDGVRAAIRALPEAQRRVLDDAVGPIAVDAFARGEAVEKLGRVYVLPGIMGSLLSIADGSATDRIWINALRLAIGAFDRLRHPVPEEVLVDGLHRSYLPLVMRLDTAWDVVPVGYDWRLGLDVAADRLAERIRQDSGPAHLVAHSMGGLVCRMLRARHKAAWQQLARTSDGSTGGRLVMLGTPSLGSLAIATALTGEDKMVRWLSLLDLRNKAREIRSIVASFPGVYQLLLSPDVRDGDSQHARLYDAAAWAGSDISSDLLKQAHDIHAELAKDGFDEERTFYIAGTGHATPYQVAIDRPGRFRFRTTTAGDGRVTHDAGLGRGPDGDPALANAWYSPADHGGLLRDVAVRTAVGDILRTGDTDSLPDTPHELLRGAATRRAWVRGDELETPPLIHPVPFDGVLRGRSPNREEQRRSGRVYVDEATRSWLGTRPAGGVPPAPLTLSVRHASLEHASNVVVVGHYVGTVLGGAEEYADRILGGRLTARQVLGRYPSTTADVLRVVPDAAAIHEGFHGVMVVGLGEMGELTPSELSRAIRNAALEHALVSIPPRSDAGDSHPELISLSSVLIGSYGPDALQLPTAISALVEGVILANLELASSASLQPVRIDRFEIVEVYEQRAEDAARVLQDIDRYLPVSRRAGATLVPADQIEAGEGARPGAPSELYGAGTWRRLIVNGPEQRSDGDQVALTFTSLGSRARAALLPHEVNQKLIDRMVREAVVSPQVDSEVNVSLFELLLPNDLKRELASVENLVLVVDDHTANIPWEALADRSALTGPEPLVKRLGLVRQLKLVERPQADLGVLHTRALVVGDPPAGPRFPRLEGARREARAVKDLLFRADVRVIEAIFDEDASAERSAREVVGKLLAHDYQIVHIAGHGWFEPAPRGGRPIGGVAIGSEQFLTALEIGQMRHPPSLVFLNCCHLASTTAEVLDDGAASSSVDRMLLSQRRRRPELAASLARTLMANGVRAVVAAGWSVQDRAAEEFARVLYTYLLDGEAFGPAVRAARIATHQVDGGASNTWAAYQCYGDPAFRLRTPGAGQLSSAKPVSASEVVRVLEVLAVSAGDSGADRAALAAEVRALEEASVRRWDPSGQVWAALGAAYAECGEFAAAVRTYRRALNCKESSVKPQSGVPLKAIEQLANLEARLAGQLESGARPDDADLEALTSEGQRVTPEMLQDCAKHRIAALLSLGKTPERLAISAAFWKGVAASTIHDNVRSDAIRKAAVSYYESWKLGNEKYPALNALQLDGPGGVLPQTKRGELLKVLGDDDFLSDGSGFWDRVAPADLALTRALIDGTVTDTATLTAVRDAYHTAFQQRSTARERSSPTRHIDELSRLAQDCDVKAALSSLASDLSEWRPTAADTLISTSGVG